MFAHTKFNMLCTSSLVVQFSKINTAALNPSQPVRWITVPFRAISLRQPVYYTTFPFACQGVFEKFFEVFFEGLSKGFWNRFFLPSACVRLVFSAPSFSGAWLLYHFLFRLSRGFSKVFRSFFRWLSSSTSRYGFASSAFPLAQRPVVFIKPSFRALDYYTTFLRSCQAFLRQKHSQKHRRFDTEKLPFSQSVILQSQSAPADAKIRRGAPWYSAKIRLSEW